MKYLKPYWIVALCASMLLFSATSQAEIKFSAGAKLLPGHTWSGSNYRDGETEFESKATQLVVLGALRADRLYGAFSFQGAEYKFSSPAPDINDKTSSSQVSNEKIKLGESDLTVGYYVTPHVSLFADIKSVTYQWVDSKRKLSYQGLGVGVSGFHPINNIWSLYGNFGIASNMQIRSNGEKIGKAFGYALEFGGITRLADRLSGNVGLKLQGQALKFDSGATQTHGRGGLVLGIVYQF